MTNNRRPDPADLEKLLWRLADRYTRVRPASFGHAGDLVVLDSPITWETPWRTEGGFNHHLPAGSHPVYVGTTPFIPDGEDPDASWHTVTVVVIPLAEPSAIAAADWNVPGYHDAHFIEDYAVLWGDEAMRASLPHEEDGTPAFVRTAPGDSWTNVVLDRETGANAFVFPVGEAEYVTGHEIVDDQRNLLCLVLVACE
ncbi:hypothetical protein [Lentzea terrae]|uniref:hypothetical protein n=1 Tax=Lentzea terrae TaxID=2200761 RepID=UPI000DD32A15|nr:hypothetical protein [Lentzea terrae]